jgi:hypothetical protein
MQAAEPLSRRNRLAILLAWVGALLALAWNEGALVLADPVLSRDDQTLLRPLEAMHRLGDYFAAFRAHRLLDLQPVRDASLWLDLVVQRWVGHGVHHLVNLLLLVAILVLLQALAVALVGNRPAAAAIVLVFACHPIVANTVSWIATRKHLLACAFILAATWLVRRRERPGLAAYLSSGALYLLSVFSQPIMLLWPAWLALDAGLRQGRRAAARIAAAFLPLVAFAGWANFVYYRGAYTTGGATKLVALSPAVSLLSLGRDLFNAIAPVAITTTYYPGRSFNLVGLIALPILVGLSIKLLPRREALSGWAFFAFPLVVVTGWMTNIFVSDTYLLVPLAALLLLFAQVWCARPPREPLRRLAPIAIAGVSLVLALLSRPVAASWRSDEALWTRAYAVEPSPSALARYADQVLQHGRIAEARQLAIRLAEWAPNFPGTAKLLARSIYLDRTLPAAQRVEWLDRASVRDAWTDYFSASLEAEAGNFGAALARMRAAAPSAVEFGGELANVAAEARAICQRANAPDCDALTARFRSAAPPRFWDEARFQARLARLGAN